MAIFKTSNSQKSKTLWKRNLNLTAVFEGTAVKALGPKPALLEMTKEYTLNSRIFSCSSTDQEHFYMHLFVL